MLCWVHEVMVWSEAARPTCAVDCIAVPVLTSCTKATPNCRCMALWTVAVTGIGKRLHVASLQVKAVNGSSILRLLKGLGLAPEIPEDLYHLIKKAVSMRKHLELFRKDKDGKFRLILVESRIHRLARYYRVSGRLSRNACMSRF